MGGVSKLLKAGARWLAAVLVIVAGWTIPAGAQPPVKVGMLLTYVGPTALFARYEAKGARVLLEQVNKTGGINGRPLEVINYDTEGKPDRAASLYRRLAQEDKVVAVIGPDSIFVTLGMSSVPNEVKVPSVAAPGNYELIEPKNREFIVSAWGSHGYAMAMVLAYFKDRLKVNRIGVMTTADTIGQWEDKVIREVGKLVGIEVVDTASQPASDRDLLPSLRPLRQHRRQSDRTGGTQRARRIRRRQRHSRADQGCGARGRKANVFRHRPARRTRHAPQE